MGFRSEGKDADVELCPSNMSDDEMSGIFDGLGESCKPTSSHGESIFVPSSQLLQILTENFHTGCVLGFSESSPLFIQSSNEENASTSFYYQRV